LAFDLSTKEIKDKHGRTYYEKPSASDFFVFNRAFRYRNSNAETHHNDLKNTLRVEPKLKANILAMICDNGPDFNPASLLVFYYMGMLWKSLALDILFLCSFAPHSSKYNFIEVAWGALSKALAQITLVSDHKKYNLNDEENVKKLFGQAMEELHLIWSNTTYAGRSVKCKTVNVFDEENPMNIFAELQDAIKKGKNHSQHSTYKKEIAFLVKHSIKRPYFLQFTKCSEKSCTHCTENPIKNHKAMDLLHEFENQLPVPILFEELYEGKHYPSFIDIIRTEALRKRYIEKMKDQLKKKKENHEICEKCTWHFESKADEQKHKRYCPKK
jgi:hypothetical protein